MTSIESHHFLLTSSRRQIHPTPIKLLHVCSIYGVCSVPPLDFEKVKINAKIRWKSSDWSASTFTWSKTVNQCKTLNTRVYAELYNNVWKSTNRYSDCITHYVLCIMHAVGCFLMTNTPFKSEDSGETIWIFNEKWNFHFILLREKMNKNSNNRFPWDLIFFSFYHLAEDVIEFSYLTFSSYSLMSKESMALQISALCFYCFSAHTLRER